MPKPSRRSSRGKVNVEKASHVQAARRSNNADIDLDAAIDNGSQPTPLHQPARAYPPAPAGSQPLHASLASLASLTSLASLAAVV